MGRDNLKFNNFCLKMVLNRCTKNVFLQIFHCKAWWKPGFAMNQRPLLKGPIANFGISLDVFDFLIFFIFFYFFFSYLDFPVQLQCILEVLKRGGSVVVTVLVMTGDM